MCFVKSGSVQFGSYVYDEPSTEDDPRIVPRGQVPARYLATPRLKASRLTAKAARSLPHARMRNETGGPASPPPRFSL